MLCSHVVKYDRINVACNVSEYGTSSLKHVKRRTGILKIPLICNCTYYVQWKYKLLIKYNDNKLESCSPFSDV